MATSIGNKNKFYEWLINVESDKAASDMISSVGMLNLLMNKRRIIENHIFDIDDPDEVNRLAENIKMNRGMRIHSKNSRALAIRSLYAYRDFLQEKNTEKNFVDSQETVQSDDSVADFSTFIEWMRDRGDMSERTCNSYASNLRSLLVFCSENKITENDFSRCEVDELESVSKQILENDAFVRYNAIQHNRFSAALKKYVEFRTGKEVATSRRSVIRTSANTENWQENINKAEATVLQADTNGLSYDELQEALRESMSETKRIVFSAEHLIDIKGRLYHEAAFVDWDEGATQLDAIVEKLIKKNNGYVSAAQLYDYSHAEMHLFLNDNDLDDERSVYEMAQHLFEKNAYAGKNYTFTGKSHISKNVRLTSNFDVFCKYAEEQGGIFRFSDLKEYLTGIGIRVGNLRGQMRIYSDSTFLYYDENLIVHKKVITRSNDWQLQVKTALDKLFSDVGDHIVLRDIQQIWFDELPDLSGGLLWTHLLLQSVLKHYSKELGAHTISAMDTQSIETLHTMLVRNDSPIRDFGDVVISLLFENEIPTRIFEAEELRTLLVDLNVIQGGELIGNMPKALGKDERFAWNAEENVVTVRI